MSLAPYPLVNPCRCTLLAWPRVPLSRLSHKCQSRPLSCDYSRWSPLTPCSRRAYVTPGYHHTKMFQVCTLERIPYIFLSNDAIDIYIILTESHDQGLSNKPIYILRNTLVNEIHVEQSKSPKHLKHFWGHCILYQWYGVDRQMTLKPMKP